ncbi:MAG: DUF3363 domain-containing protein [Alphaproteobacteria bacterium]
MLLERYDELLKGGDVISDGDTLLGDAIDSRKSYFRRLNMGGGGKSKRYRGGSYRQGNMRSNKPISQRVLVKAHFKKHGTSGAGGSGSAGNLRGHLSYITRDGAGVDDTKPVLFGSDGDELGRVDFYHACKDDRHHFRFIISPENGHEIADMEGYIRGVMGQVEKDLSTKLEWVSAVHYDTDNPHAHVVVRGKDDLGKDLVIAPDYISNGIRMRAEELATEILGERSIEDIQRSMEKETDAMRVTSLDRFIEARASEEEKEAGEIVVDTRDVGYSGRDEFYDGLLKKRLEFLTTTAMAVQDPPGVFTVRFGYTVELKEVSERHDIIKQLNRSMPEEAMDEGVSVYAIDADGEAPVVRGEIEKIAHMNELTDHKYMVVRDVNGGLNYVALALNDRNEALLEGGVVEVSAGEKASLKADRSIGEVALGNDGIYSRDAHLEFVREHKSFIKEPEGYVDYHGKRLSALEKVGIVEDLGDGQYRVPEDVIEQGGIYSAEQDAKYKKKQLAQVKSLSVSAIKDAAFVMYDLADEDAPRVQGRVEQVGRVEAGSDKRFMLVRDGDEVAHYVPLYGKREIKEGAIVDISIAQKAKGGADYNIGMIAKGNDGVYSREAHKAFLDGSEKRKDIDDIDAYLDHHAVRLKTLDEAGIVEATGYMDRYSIPEDVVERGDALNASRGENVVQKAYAQVKAISGMSIDSQVDAKARTFLDLEIYRHQQDYNLAYRDADRGTIEAIHERQSWLAEHGYAYHREGDGKFIMKGDAMDKLYKEELESAGQVMSKALKAQGYKAIDLKNEQKDTMRYMGFVDLHSGHHIVAEKDGFITLVKAQGKTDKWITNEPVKISKGAKGIIVERDILNQSKEETLEMLSEKMSVASQDVDFEDGQEVSYIGAVHLKDGAYAAVSHDEHVSLVRVKDYPIYEAGQSLEIAAGKDGFADIKETNRQQELELNAVKEIEKSKDEDVEIDW